MNKGLGDCSEFSDLFVQLCSINNIPARTVYGYVFRSQNKTDYEYNHAWAEIYLNEKGWIPVETISDTSLVKLLS